MSNGEGCTCNAWNESECACNADWTPKELIDARERIEELTRIIAGLRAELTLAKLYIMQVKLIAEEAAK